MMKKNSKRNRISLILLAIALVTGLPETQALNGGFIFHGPIRRLLTPDSSFNRVAIFCVENPADSGISGQIYSLTGRPVSDMTVHRQNSDPRYFKPMGGGCPADSFNPQSLTWDGHANGRIVSSGVYLYQISVENRFYTGAILVVR